VQRALDAYARAIESRDMAALRRAAPDMRPDERARWAKVFTDARRVDAELTVTDIQVGGNTIIAAVRSRIDLQLVGSRPAVSTDVASVATLVRDSSGWRLRSAP
jgi:serine/threonine-protein kinase